MTGIASGRLLSMGVDGSPAPNFLFYLAAELALAVTSLTLIFLNGVNR